MTAAHSTTAPPADGTGPPPTAAGTSGARPATRSTASSAPPWTRTWAATPGPTSPPWPRWRPTRARSSRSGCASPAWSPARWCGGRCSPRPRAGSGRTRPRPSSWSADGTRAAAGDVVARLSGPTRTLLVAERTGLNLVGRACGVATATRAWVDVLAGTGVQVLDTRKTTPGLRAWEKYAVRCGGGVNKRVGLFDVGHGQGQPRRGGRVGRRRLPRGPHRRPRASPSRWRSRAPTSPSTSSGPGAGSSCATT